MQRKRHLRARAVLPIQEGGNRHKSREEAKPGILPVSDAPLIQNNGGAREALWWMQVQDGHYQELAEVAKTLLLIQEEAGKTSSIGNQHE